MWEIIQNKLQEVPEHRLQEDIQLCPLAVLRDGLSQVGSLR